MSDSFSEVTSQSWFSRLGGAFKGILVGLAFFVGALLLLFWNEGRAVKRHKALEEGGGAVVSVSANKVESGNEGKLIHTSGLATTDEILTDPIFPVSENALRLRRDVEVYQWKEITSSETRNKLGGGTETVTTYRYEKAWSSDAIDSGNFKEPQGHENRGFLPYGDEEIVASNVKLGAFVLPQSEVSRIDRWEDLEVVQAEAGPATASGLPDGAEAWNGGYYIGIDPSEPQIEDMKIRFAVVRPTEISLVAKQVSNSITPYQTSNGGSINLQQLGMHSAESMFKVAVQSNKNLTWILRALGFFLMFLGLKMVLAPLAVLADVVPLFGRIVGAGTSAISFLLAGVLSLLTIAFAWIIYRPLLAITLLVLAGACIFLIVKKMSGTKVVLPPIPNT